MRNKDMVRVVGVIHHSKGYEKINGFSFGDIACFSCSGDADAFFSVQVKIKEPKNHRLTAYGTKNGRTRLKKGIHNAHTLNIPYPVYLSSRLF